MDLSNVLPPQTWRRRLAITAAVVLLLYAGAGFFLVPSLARPRLEALVSDAIGKPVRIGGVGFNPFALSLALRDVALDDEGAPVIAFDELYADVRAVSLLRFAVVLDSLHLQAPQVRLVIDKQGRLNLGELFASPQTNEPPPVEPVEDAELFPVHISNATIAAGRLVFRDEQPAEPFEIELTPVALELKGLSTRRNHSGTYVISAKTENDGSIDWRGDLSIDPLWAQGDIALDKIQARTLARYAGKLLPFGVESGTLGLKTTHRYTDDGKQWQLRLGPGDVTLDGLDLREANGSPPFLTLPQLQVGGVEIDLQNESVRIASVRSKGARLKAWLAADGAMGPPALFGQPEAAKADAAPAAAPTGKGWSLVLDQVTIADYGLAFEDRSLSPPFALAVEPIAAKIGGLSLAAGKKATVAVELGLPDAGSIKLNGTAGITPLDVDIEVQVANILLNRVQPYLARAARIDLDSGTAGAAGRVRVHAGDGEAAVIEYTGNADVRTLVVNDTARDEELVKWTSLALDAIAYRSQPASLHIAGVVLDQPYARIVIDKTGKLNLAGLAVESPATKAPPAQASSQPAMAIAIDTLEIRDGLTDFADYSIKPAVDTGIYNLAGKIEGLSSDPRAKSKLALAGSVDKHAPVKITGVINPFNPMTQTDVAVKFENVSLTLFTPYSARFAGYKIKKGKASVELDYHIENRKLVAENTVVLDKLTLGDKVEGPDATSLPVKLALALLKDRKGQIDIDLPIRGDLDDPKFSYTRILGKALFDLIQKTVASPFAALGSLASFDSEELSHVDFAPGSATLDEAQSNKLDAIGQALRDRPELRLEVTGRAAPVADKKELADVELVKELKRAKRAELKAKGLEAPKKLSLIELSTAEYDRLFEAKYRAQFGAKPSRDERGGISGAARNALAGSLTVEDEDLRKLAQKRAAAIQDRLAEAGVGVDRVYILEVEIDAESAVGEVSSDLSLTG